MKRNERPTRGFFGLAAPALLLFTLSPLYQDEGPPPPPEEEKPPIREIMEAPTLGDQELADFLAQHL